MRKRKKKSVKSPRIGGRKERDDGLDIIVEEAKN